MWGGGTSYLQIFKSSWNQWCQEEKIGEEEQVWRKGVPFTFKHKYMEFIDEVRANDVAKESTEEKGKKESKLF